MFHHFDASPVRCQPFSGTTINLRQLESMAHTASTVQCSLQRVEPEGSRIRALSAPIVRCGQYSVPFPNVMWHIDGNHTTYQTEDSNSRWHQWFQLAESLSFSFIQTCTVLSYFTAALNEYGLPYQVRSDKGGENIGVAKFMVANRGEGRIPHTTGRSVHNGVRSVNRGMFTSYTSLCIRKYPKSKLRDPTRYIFVFPLSGVLDLTP
ncbi:uncharacterized protein LOC118825892 [Colossoma macropomum]|uniref:uncharacterized protein LOC118825892 n=1 Tax=Colossoma macropomum TaxID=42526 RepID=UPI0018655568|nr:uncharacterized protein LOC118825892 [Colossoma macropomum]